MHTEMISVPRPALGRSGGAVTDEEQGQQDEDDEAEERRAELLDVVAQAQPLPIACHALIVRLRCWWNLAERSGSFDGNPAVAAVVRRAVLA